MSTRIPHLLLTGASSGIGAATLRVAVAAGWRVSAVARRLDLMQAQAASLPVGSCLPLAADVCDAAALATAVARAVASFGPIDALVANAGRGLDGELLEISPEALTELFDLNLVGVHRCVLATRPHWAPGACIVLVASVASSLPIPRMGAYCASKAALASYAAALRMELANAGHRVCSIHPGTVRTDFFSAAPKPGRVWSWRPGTALAPEVVARVILRQARHGRPMRVTVPTMARLAETLYRLLPGPMEALMRRQLARMRDAEGSAS